MHCIDCGAHGDFLLIQAYLRTKADLPVCDSEWVTASGGTLEMCLIGGGLMEVKVLLMWLWLMRDHENHE